MRTVDLICEARWVVPVEPFGVVLENHDIVVDGGKIIALLPHFLVHQQYTARKTLPRTNHLIIPGFINAHTHAAMSLFRGLADDLPLMDWLSHHVWPAERSWLSQQFVQDGTRLAIAEMLRSGTTCFNDMYFFPDTVGMVAATVGIRASVGLIVIDYPTAWARTHEEYFEKAEGVYRRFKGHPLISTALAPHAPYSVNDKALIKVAALAKEWGVPIQIHTHETEDEIIRHLEEHRKRPLQRLFELFWGQTLVQHVHMAWLSQDDFSMLTKSNAHIVHCPESNLKLASGFCPVPVFLKQKINVALGTDGAASNNDLDMLQEMRSAAFMAKGVSKDSGTLNTFQALEMATLAGARAMGIDDKTGSLLPGKSADFIAIDLNAPETQPLYHPLSQLVYAASRNQVTDVWVAGVQLLADRNLTTLDLEETLSKAKEWGVRIQKSEY